MSYCQPQSHHVRGVNEGVFLDTRWSCGDSKAVWKFLDSDSERKPTPKISLNFYSFILTAWSSCKKERIWRWISQCHVCFLTATDPHEEDKQKICGTLSLERSSANFSSKKENRLSKSHRSCMSFPKGLYQEATLDSHKLQAVTPRWWQHIHQLIWASGRKAPLPLLWHIRVDDSWYIVPQTKEN